MDIQYRLDAKFGTVYLGIGEKGLFSLSWKKLPGLECKDMSTNSEAKEIGKQLEEYFMGKRDSFDCRLDLRGTDFQIRAWKELLKINYGTTCSYEDIAIGLGDKNKVRAVGGANGKNHIPIIIPCHRVIAKSGGLGGYSGGLPLKRKLLAIEGANVNVGT